MANLLSKCGLIAGHESVFREKDYLGWGGWEAEVSCWYPHWREQEPIEGDVLLLHQTRNPLDSINSNAAHWDHLLGDAFEIGSRDIWEQSDHVLFPELHKFATPIEKSMVYYVLQNEAIESMGPFFQYQVEEINAQRLVHLFSLVGKKPDPVSLEDALGHTPTDTNPLPDYCIRGIWNTTFDELPENEYKPRLANMIGRYGYAEKHACGR